MAIMIVSLKYGVFVRLQHVYFHSWSIINGPTTWLFLSGQCGAAHGDCAIAAIRSPTSGDIIYSVIRNMNNFESLGTNDCAICSYLF